MRRVRRQGGVEIERWVRHCSEDSEVYQGW